MERGDSKGARWRSEARGRKARETLDWRKQRAPAEFGALCRCSTTALSRTDGMFTHERQRDGTVARGGICTAPVADPVLRPP